MSLKRTAFWTAFWIAISLLFNIGLYFWMGHQKALEFLAGYVIEKSLSMDNLFLFLVIFSYFRIEPKCQRRVLNYGILAAILLRLTLIVIGVTIVNQFHWVLYIVGITLIYSACKIIFVAEKKIDPSKSKIIRIAKRAIPVTEQLHGEKFFVKIRHQRFVTPLFIILLIVETTDLVFALDSIPAIFSVTTDSFIIFTSNILAILGLRSLYFFLERIKDLFIYVKQGVGVILFFAGIKLLLPMFKMNVPIDIALSIILIILITSIIASLIARRGQIVLFNNSNSLETPMKSERINSNG